MPLVKDQRYLLFLTNESRIGYGDYSIVYGFQGRYAITEASTTNAIKDLTCEDILWRKDHGHLIHDATGKPTSHRVVDEVLKMYLTQDYKTNVDTLYVYSAL